MFNKEKMKELETRVNFTFEELDRLITELKKCGYLSEGPYSWLNMGRFKYRGVENKQDKILNHFGLEEFSETKSGLRKKKKVKEILG